MTQVDDALLSTDEEITLRRVAHGESEVAFLRAPDLARLRALALVEGQPRMPRLTAAGRTHFDRLARPVALADFDVQRELAATIERLEARRQRRRA